MSDSNSVAVGLTGSKIGRWCQSRIAQQLWREGRLLPPYIGKVNQYVLQESSRSFIELQRKLRLPVRLATYLSVNCNLADSYTSRKPILPSRPEIIARGLLGSVLYETALKHVKLAAEFRGEPALIYGQRFITPESSVCRAALISKMLQANNPRIVFLGDDDLTSIAVSTILNNSDITVIDIDKTVLDAIQTSCTKLGLGIKLQGHDLSQPIPKELRGRFDCFVGDPYPTPNGSFESWFINCGVEFIDPAGEQLGLITFAPTHKAPGFRRVLINQLSKNFLIREIIEDACDYEMIPGELTQIEYEYLQSVVESTFLISHSKSYLFISPKLLMRYVHAEGLPIKPWLALTRSHELSLRLGGEERLRSELYRTVDYETWSIAYEASTRMDTSLDISQILSDLIGDEVTAQKMKNFASEQKLSEFYNLVDKVVKDRAVAREASTLVAAAQRGPVTSYNAYSVEFELYLLARLYESYYRGASPLQSGGL
jgi:hypothetical protein